MKLSVIIVNYNVRSYLEQCLRTVFTALEGIEGEVFVVDNLSTDGSLEAVRGKFPRVKLIANKENVGFSRANNQAIRMAEGEYVLLLNPDTVVGEDVFHKVISFMDAHPRAGGLGVKMIDGTGWFLPESKRGLPTPAVAFFKIIGLTRLFPRSKLFGRYHLGHLPENEAAPIETLSGACMFLRKKTLDEVGLLDEHFFMYGEDIDLSYRITLGGYENWYYPEARIIHYKGESTKKSTVNYVFVFYNAMAIFARKHFTRKGPDLFAGLIRGSIYLSAAGAIVTRFLQQALLPIIDAIVLMALFCLLPNAYLWSWVGVAPMLLLFTKWTAPAIASLAFFGGYDRPIRLGRAMLGSLVATAIVLFAIGLPEIADDWIARTIVAAILIGGPLITRTLFHLLRVRTYSLRDQERQRVLAIGSKAETSEALALLWQTHFGLGWKDGVEPAQVDDQAKRLARSIRQRGVDEVVFCAKDIPWQRIIAWMEQLRYTRAEFKIMQPGAEFIIGTSSIESLQDLLIMERHAVNSAAGRRSKRLADVIVALALLITLPVSILFIRHKTAFTANWWNVLKGRMSWVGYHAPSSRSPRLPWIKPGVIDPVMAADFDPLPIVVERLNLSYAKDYSAWADLRLVWRGFAMLGG